VERRVDVRPQRSQRIRLTISTTAIRSLMNKIFSRRGAENAEKKSTLRLRVLA
jgi:hypothetical protein